MYALIILPWQVPYLLNYMQNPESCILLLQIKDDIYSLTSHIMLDWQPASNIQILALTFNHANSFELFFKMHKVR
jgi:hypothetical protein